MRVTVLMASGIACFGKGNSYNFAVIVVVAVASYAASVVHCLHRTLPFGSPSVN